MKATVTPAPVMPWACTSLACVVVRSSGSSGSAGVPQIADGPEPRPILRPGRAAGT